VQELTIKHFARRAERKLRRDGKNEQADQLDKILDSPVGEALLVEGVLEKWDSYAATAAFGDGEILKAFLDWLSDGGLELILDLILTIIGMFS
jgi:hypothetical protein